MLLNSELWVESFAETAVPEDGRIMFLWNGGVHISDYSWSIWAQTAIFMCKFFCPFEGGEYSRREVTAEKNVLK